MNMNYTKYLDEKGRLVCPVCSDRVHFDEWDEDNNCCINCIPCEEEKFIRDED